MRMIVSDKDQGYRQCAISLMDNIADPDIQFDKDGICNYYYDYKKLEKEHVFSGEEGKSKLEEFLNKIRTEGKGKQYDCVTGISGGVDSTFLVWKAKQWGLRPLIVHFDNGWDSEIAVNNINNIIKYTGFDLYTIVVNWEEFRDLQLSYIKASVVDIEVPTDHAISGTLQRLAAKYNVKYILSGNNVVTEAILPKSWIFNKNDYVNLKNIHDKFGKVPLKTYPLFGLREKYVYEIGKGIQTFQPLNLVDFNKDKAKQVIAENLNWRDYKGKHYESVFTKFYQAYILPNKFHIDKRKAHLSNLIFSRQITKDQALEEISKPLYEELELKQDLEYVLKKFGLSSREFEQLMNQERVEHEAYGVQKPLAETYRFLKILRPLKKILPDRRSS
ncbi:MAG: N-acetyl sugar amidotransferase [Bacteroidetes bacterium]|nr:MAG: N-acetyl sugar amidotransferase [Bacteroidota bacterium]